jgi:D-glycero-D-manno-heptose 1,7-bisphosphate phosphatase
MATKNKCLFIDRDGTLNVEVRKGYLNEPEKTVLIPGCGHALAKAKEAGFLLSVITNQAGVAKGLTPKENLPKILDKLCELIKTESGLKEFSFDDARYCLHLAEDKCACRKPETLNLKTSLEFLNASKENSFFIGDRETDLECAHRFGMPYILVRTGYGEETLQMLSNTHSFLQPAYVAKNLQDAIDWILKK